MARYIDADLLDEEIDKLQDSLSTNNDVLWSRNKPIYKALAYTRKMIREDVPTADVVERGPFAKRLLLDLKAAVTNKATYPDFNADYAYVNLKVFNALVQEFIKKYEGVNDMARYIDADRFKRNLENAMKKMHVINGVHAVGLEEVIESLNRQPTADVVPKSEFEQLKEYIDDLNDSKEHLCVMLEEARADVAREIFEEIEKLFGGTTMMWLRTTPWQWEDYEELKKKYVEGKDES